MTATYCWEDDSITVVDGWVGAISGVDHPAFASLLAQTTLDLFPTRNENWDDDRDRKRFGS